MKKFILILLSIPFLLALGFLRPDTVTVSFGTTTLNIPRDYLLSKLPSTLVPSKGLDSDRGVVMRVPKKAMGIDSEGKKNTFLVRVYKNSPRNINARAEVWKTPDKTVVEFNEEIGMYRVYEKHLSYLWHYFLVPPSKFDKGEYRDLWVGHCREGAVSVSCSVYVNYQNVGMKINVNEYDLQQHEVLKRKFVQLLQSWEMP